MATLQSRIPLRGGGLPRRSQAQHPLPYGIAESRGGGRARIAGGRQGRRPTWTSTGQSSYPGHVPSAVAPKGVHRIAFFGFPPKCGRQRVSFRKSNTKVG